MRVRAHHLPWFAAAAIGLAHPLTPERIARLQAAIAEIRAKQAAGDPLMPETRP